MRKTLCLLGTMLAIIACCAVAGVAQDVNPYVGNDAKTCAMCHKAQVAAWQAWPMSKAWDALSADEQKKEECVKCHVTGYGEPGGWVSMEKTPALVGIQCEACHGPAGNHMQAPLADVEKKKATVVLKPDEPSCLRCHVAAGNPNFVEFKFKDAVAKLADHLKGMTAAPTVEGQAQVAPTTETIAYVGDPVKNCNMCHKKQVDAWLLWPMAASWTQLKPEEQAKEECVKCHVTGFGQPGGWVSIEKTPKLAGISCEACHGPAGNHMKVPLADVEKKKGSISLSPGEQVCLQCHVKEGNPNFKEFVYTNAAAALANHKRNLQQP